MAKIIVFNNDTNRMETYYRDVSQAMPYNNNRTLTVEAQAEVLHFGQQKGQCKVLIQQDFYLALQYQLDLHLKDHGRADTEVKVSIMQA